jgi:hypothetical protein
MVARFSLSSQGSTGKEFAMRVYYRGPDALVTSELFVRRSSPAERFAIRELRDVCITRGGVTGAGLGTGIILLAAAALVAAAIMARSGAFLVSIALLAGVIMAGGLIIPLWWRRPRRRQLQATYRGRKIDLYASADERVFNQVSRALRRALEDAEPPHWDDVRAA